MTFRFQSLPGFRISVFLVSMWFFIGCGKKEPQNIKIGAMLPLTGDTAEYGTRCKVGIDMAVSEINSPGGIKGQKIEMIYEDYRGSAKDAAASMQKLGSVDQVSAVIGPVESTVALATVPIATQHKVLLFSPTASSPDLSGSSPLFFRNWPSDVFEASRLARFAFEDLKLRQVVIFYVNNDYGLGLKKEFSKTFTELGGKILAEESYRQGESQFRSALTKLKAQSPDAFYLAGYHKELALASKQLRELGVKSQILASANYGTDELLTIAGEAAEKAIYANPDYNPRAKDEAIQVFVQTYRKAHNADPTIFEANCYDAMKIIAKALESGAKTGTEIGNFIANLKDYPGASGRMSFNAKGDVTKPISINTVLQGKFVPYTKGNSGS